MSLVETVLSLLRSRSQGENKTFKSLKKSLLLFNVEFGVMAKDTRCSILTRFHSMPTQLEDSMPMRGFHAHEGFISQVNHATRLTNLLSSKQLLRRCVGAQEVRPRKILGQSSIKKVLLWHTDNCGGCQDEGAGCKNQVQGGTNRPYMPAEQKLRNTDIPSRS